MVGPARAAAPRSRASLQPIACAAAISPGLIVHGASLALGKCDSASFRGRSESVAPRRGRRPRSSVQPMSADDRFTVKNRDAAVALIVVGAVTLLLALTGLAIQLITGPSVWTSASGVLLLVLALYMFMLGTNSLRRAKK